MNSPKLIGAGIALIALLAILVQSLFTVAETENALVVQLGDPKRVIEEPGLQLKLPFIQSVVKIDKRNLEYDLANAQEISDVNQERLTVDAFVRYQITDPLLFYQRFRPGTSTDARLIRQNGQARIQSILISSLRETLGEVTISDVVTNLRAELMNRIEERMQTEASTFGVNIIDVKISQADYPQDIANNVYEQMRSERQESAQLIRSEGQRESTRIRAEADRRKAEILAEANRQSLEIKGTADGRRNAIFNEAFGKDPEFFRFYRNLQAYETALQEGETTIVLSPDSEFLRYFNNVEGTRNDRR